MTKERELSQSEIDFIEDSLIGKNMSINIEDKSNVSISKNKITPIEKQFNKINRKKKIYLLLVRIFAIMPFLFTALVLLLAASFVGFAQGNVALMLEQLTTVSQSSEIVSASSLESLTQFATLYDNRWIIIATIFTVFGILVFIFLIMYWSKKEESQTFEEEHFIQKD